MRLTPGALRLWFLQKFGDGLRVAYYRDMVRPRILKTPPFEGLTDPACEIHCFTSKEDWLNLIWALKSFYAASGRRYKLCIHDDGSLGTVALSALRQHFPDARIIGRPEADHKVFSRLRNHPKCLEFRRQNLLAPKVFDFTAFLEAERFLMFDSDLIFVKEPVALLCRIESPDFQRNAFNADCGHGYTVQPDEVRGMIGHELIPCINSGLGLIQQDSIQLDWCEEFLHLPGILDGHFWRIEQTLIALCSSRFGAELLPDEYTLFLELGIADRPFRHYVGKIRHLMYSEGIPALLRNGALLKPAPSNSTKVAVRV